MVNLDALAPGIRVKIVDEWKPGCGQNVNGLMDKYLGQIVTILDVDVDEDTATIEEDRWRLPLPRRWTLGLELLLFRLHCRF